MSFVDIGEMYREMRNTMECNFKGSPEQRFKQAKKQFLESVARSIDDNKKELIAEYKERNK